MRLLKLKLKNIASLKGEHLIEFDKLTNESPLFAITGETGSGKSTILNSVAMALYGRVYKSSLTQADIVTLGEREGQIQLIFKIKGQNYLAEWKGRIRKPNGEVLKKPTLDRYIQKIDGEDFSDSRSGDNLSADDILNLNFDQFCKCIILNQGEFSKFISSSFTERKAILEKLYPGNEIENVSKFLKQNLDQSEQKLTVLNTQLETLSFNPEAGEKLKNDHQEVLTQKNIFFGRHKRYVQLKKNIESLETYHKYFHESVRRKDKLMNEIKEDTVGLNESLLFVEKTQKDFEAITRLNEEQTPQLQNLLKKEEQSLILAGLIQEQNQKLAKIRNKLALDEKERENFTTNKNELHLKLLETAKLFKSNPDELIRLRAEAESFVDNCNKFEKLSINLKNAQEKLAEVEDKGRKLKEEISVLEEKAGHPLDAINRSLETLRGQKAAAQELHTNFKVWEETKNILLRRSQEMDKQALKKNQELVLLNEEIKRTTPLIKSLELSLSLYDYQMGLKACLDHAKREEMDNCPLCQTTVGKTHWQNNTFTFSAEDFEQLQKDLIKNKDSITGLNHKKLLTEEDSLKLQEELSHIQIELKSIEEKLGKELPDLLKIDEQISTTQKQLHEREHTEKELLKLKSEIQKTRENYLLHKDALTRLENEILPVQNELTQLGSQLLIITPNSPLVTQDLREDLRLLARLLEERKRLEQCEDQEKFTLVRIKEAKEEILHTDELLAKTSGQLKQIQDELFEKLQGQSPQEQLNALGLKMKEAIASLQKAQDQHKVFDQKISLNRGNLASVEQVLKDYELRFLEQISQIKTLLEENISPLNEEVLHFENKLKKLSLSIDDSIDIISALKEFVSKTLILVDERLTVLNQEEGTMREKLSQWEKMLDKIKLLELESQEIKEKHQRLKRLSSILGTDELRTFALSLVEENLILQTNEELKNLCDARYEIIHQSRRGITPEFYVLDKFREGETRKVSTLSGGETFMVSLAMALALAELTRGQAEIDTLFIDEGFGTLDQESLEDVLNMLNQIQNRGLMIGIISHIKTLTSALPINLKLQKAQDGTSKISIVYN